jgi:hypothetical protein
MEIEHPAGRAADEDDVSPVEQVRLTVPTTDDPTLLVWTFRMWTMGFISCPRFSPSSTSSSHTAASPSSSARSPSRSVMQ